MGLVALLLTATVAGCDLTAVELVDFADIVVAEVYVSIADAPGENRLKAFIHGTGPGSEPSSQIFDDATVTITDGGGTSSVLLLSAIEECVINRPDSARGSCFVENIARTATFAGGDELGFDVTLADGRSMTGSTRIPGAFAVNGVGSGCRVPPDSQLPLRWSRSDSAWAYVSEASITGLAAPLASEGIEAADSVLLTGLSISESDTTISFPNEFGVFDRFDLEYDLAVRLQKGLPEGASAEVAITAVDRNYVNWVRGGSFNPSGTVRVSSLVGDGTGVFGASVTRRFTLLSSSDTTAGPACPTS